jgi:chorismate mutase
MERAVRGIRGAITVEANEVEAIHAATKELLLAMVQENKVATEEVAGCFITATPDLNATFPALAIRKLPGWQLVPLMCAQEMDVPGSLPKCIRMLMIVNTDLRQEEIRHIYLREAVLLRPDLALRSDVSEKEA